MALAQKWICYYNCQRAHFGFNMKCITPMEALKSYKAVYHPAIGAMPVVNLDYFSLYITDLFDISIISWDTSPKKSLVNESMAHYIDNSILYNNFQEKLLIMKNHICAYKS